MTTLFDTKLRGTDVRTVHGEGTAVMLVRSGEADSYEPSTSIEDANRGTGLNGLLVELGVEPELPNEPVLVEEEPTAEGQAVEVSLDEVFAETGGKPDYSGEKIGVLRKLASERGFRKATGLDPYKQATREQLLNFISGQE